MILAVMLSGEAEAAVVYKDCLFSHGDSEQKPPATIAIGAEIPRDVYAPILHRAAPVQTPAGTDLARDFAAFLTSPAGGELLQAAGLAPVPPEAK
jgi:ABC-type molybdate transport system substrate-binding protein